MIEKPRVLEQGFLPAEIQHRDAETSHLSDNLRPITNGNSAETSFLFGPSGAGKTCVARFTVNQLADTVGDVVTGYVNCWEHHTRFDALYHVLKGVKSTLDIHRQSTPTDVILERLRAYDGPPYVVILDEVDQLEDKSLLYELYRIRNIEMIHIANREDELFAHLDDRVKSRLSNCVRMHFAQYRLNELESILEARAHWGLAADAVDPDQLSVMADAAAGDARTAIGILRTSARLAERRNNLDEITDGVIREAVPEAKSEIRQADLNRLTSEQEIVYNIIQETSVVSPGELYAEYQARVADPKTKRTIRNYLDKMQHYNLIDAKGETKGRTYRTLKQQA